MSETFQPGSVIDGKYKVTRHIGEGGMGSVYEGENLRIGRRVAIKVLHGELPKTPELVSRFEREARAAARVGSPYICDVLDLGDLESGDRFIVMEYLEGDNLETRLEQAVKLTPIETATIAFELLAGLASVHDAGIVHRDLKPANVYLAKTPRGRGEVVKILDFGVSKFLPMGDAEAASVTQTGAVMGTPLYMSPEQARGAKEIDGRSDLYSVAVIMYRALTGRYPLLGDNFHDLLFKIALEAPPPITEIAPEVDAELAQVVMKGLSKKPEDRWESARAFHDAIASWARTNAPVSLQLLSMGSVSGMAVAAAMSTPAKPFVSPLVEKTPSETSPVARTQTSWSGDRGPTTDPGVPKELTSSESLEKAATQLAPATPVMTPAPAPAPSAARSPRGLLIGGIAAGFLLLGGGVVAVVSSNAAGSSGAGAAPPASVVTAPQVTATPPASVTEPAPSASAPASEPVSPEPPTSASAAASGAPAVAASKRPEPRGSRIPAVTAAPATAAPSASAKPVGKPAPTTSGRVFRTTFD